MRGMALMIVLTTGLLAGCAHTGTEQVTRGWVERTELFDVQHHAFRSVYDTVQLRAPFVAMLRSLNSDVETLVFLGTWCSDSRREVPRFLKIADSAGFPPASIRLYALDRTKKSADGLTARYAVELVPTFIFLKGGKEVGRIAETPQAATLEEDMVVILAKAAAGG